MNFKFKLLALIAALLLQLAPASAYRAVTTCPGSTAIWTNGATGVDPLVDIYGNVCTSTGNELPAGATALTASTTGTTGTTVAALAATASLTNYICGFSTSSNATAAATGTITVVGTIVATMSFVHWTAPLASGIGQTVQNFYPCIPASAANTAITVTGPAPGAGGTGSTTIWGYRK